MDDKLMLQVGLINQITEPLKGITKDIDTAMKTAKSGMQDMVTGGAGVVATGIAIKTALMPAIEINRKIGEVKSLQVADQTLSHLKDTAIDFSMEYGKSAAEFIGASYSIQSAIAGLKGNELSEFTKNSGILAAATKADTATITSYMGAMYGIFEKDAAALGNSNWVERVTGMTAQAVQMFNTDGNKMSQAFTSLGSSATAMGVDMAEQMAVLGMLQASMGGGEAGTKYRAFLKGAVQAQQALGLSFFDSQGKMLPMVDILDSIQDRIGHLATDQQFAILSKAFGSSEAVGLLQFLQDKTEDLGNSVVELDKNASLDTAIEQAKAMTDQWNRLDAAFFALRATVFGAVLPVFEAIAKAMADNIGWLVEWLNQYPELTQWLGYAGIAAVSLGGIIASLSLTIGIAKLMSAGWMVTISSLTGVLKILRIVTLAMTSTAWLFNAALWANPITWLVIGIGAAIAAVWVFRDYILAFLDGFISGFIEASGVAELFVPLVEIFRLIGAAIGWAFDWIVRLLTPVDAATESMAGFASAGQLVGKIIGSVFRGILMPIEVIINAIRQFINLVKKIPGVNIDFEADSHIEQAVSLANNPALNAANDSVYAATPSMVDMPTFANMQTQFTPVIRSPELTASVNPQIQPMPAFAPMAVPVTPQMGSLDNTIDTQLIDYKRPERAPQLNKNMVNNMTSSHTKETSNIRQFGDVYITTSASSFDEIEERRELDVG
ncbi:phage tail tape measure protein [Vibrio metschnikovii]|uniref:phage tail tape measure protein n=1 Tax=Vibrio metschnikovii TaxID=28172 RepID=UPI001E5386C9|nr:phage tail tape measure protein [Vibrio metschnikovii]